MSGSRRPMITDMLESLVKKDEDAVLLSLDTRSGAMQVETSIDLSPQDFYEVRDEGDDVRGSAIDSSMLRDDANGVNSDVAIRIVFTVFSAMTAYHFVTATVGVLFYLVLLYDESRLVAIVTCSVTGTLCVVMYCLAAWQRKNSKGMVFFAQLAFMRILLIASISQLIGNELLYLLEVAYLFQTASIVVYTTKWPRDDPSTHMGEDAAVAGRWWANARNSRYAKVSFIWILVVSTVVWGAGLALFASIFFRGFIWLWGIIFYVVLVAVCFYKWRYIGNMLIADGGRYSVSVDDRKLAVIEYYVDPCVLIWNKLSAI